MDVYLEDIIVFSRTFSDHLINLQRVFECLKEAGLKLNQEETQVLLFRSGVLGLLVTPSGFKPNIKNIESVKNFPVPKELRVNITLQEICQRLLVLSTAVVCPNKEGCTIPLDNRM